MKTQNQTVLDHLKEYGSITSMVAFERYRITRLSGRILELRRRGHNIITVLKDTNTGSKYAEYVLKEGEQDG